MCTKIMNTNDWIDRHGLLAEKTRIGYFNWSTGYDDGDGDEQPVRCHIYYFVLSDGSALIERLAPWYDMQGEWCYLSEVKKLAPGEWQTCLPYGSFGSRGGVWIKPL